MQGGQFPAAAANSLIEGYCKDLIDAAASLTETLGQVNHRDIDIQDCHDPLQDVRQAMAELAGAFQGVLDSGCIRSQTLTGPTDDWAAPTSSDEPTEWPGTLQKLPSTPPPQSDGVGDNPWAGITQGHDETPSPDDAAAPTWAEDPLVAQLRG
ncbi:MAG: hypothetical protein KAI24_09025, partial [Planctomycetes bacterium]|nr:hypothetical protein [Planctomycetota bacterium]